METQDSTEAPSDEMELAQRGVKGDNSSQDGDDNSVTYETKVREGVTLRRDIGLPSAISYVVGVVVGSGIFIFPQGTMQRTGSVGLCLTVWAVGGLMAFLGSLCLVELGRQVPRSGGFYAFLKETYGPLAAFLLVWTSTLVVEPSSNATTAYTFAQYVVALVQFCGSPVLPVKMVAILFVVTIGLINGHSTGVSAPVQVTGTVIKMAALVVIIIGGIVRIIQGHTESLATGFEGSVTSPGVIALSFYYVNFTYGGWESIFNIYEELKNAKRNVVLSSAGGLAVVTLVYLLTNVSYLTVLSPAQLASTPAVAFVWGERVLTGASVFLPLCVLVSVFTGTNGGTFTSSRVLYAAARDGVFPEFFSYVHVKRYTPLPSILLKVALSICFVLPNSLPDVLDFLSFCGLFFQLLIYLAVLILRYRRRPNSELDFKVPLFLPVVMLAFTLFVMVLPVVLRPSLNYLYATLLVLAGLLYYFPFVHFRLNCACLDPVVAYLQLFFEVAPSAVLKAE